MALPPPLMLDPAMLADSHPDDPDSEYEYEYHPSDTETVYLTLDLTSLHGPIRPPRRRQDPSSTNTTASTPSLHDEPDAALSSTEASANPTSDGVQILALHTPNPIIAYQNQIFSGSWADQIGTELLFSRPDTDPDHTHDHDHDHDPNNETHPITPLHRGINYDLLAANSVKILGRKANLISSSSSNVYPETSDFADTATTGVVRKSTPQTNQARFLDRLANVKRAKGETDSVRTSLSTRRAQNLEHRLRGWARTDEQLAGLNRLNELALQGDANAMAELEGLYSQFGGHEHAHGHDHESDLEL